MSYLRPFCATDLFRFNNVNLDAWTETVRSNARPLLVLLCSDAFLFCSTLYRTTWTTSAAGPISFLSKRAPTGLLWDMVSFLPGARELPSADVSLRII
jgi:hypothetical protein